MASQDEHADPHTSTYISPSERACSTRKPFRVRREDGGKIIQVTASSFEELQARCAERFSLEHMAIIRDGQDFLADDFPSASEDTLLHVSSKTDIPIAPEAQHQITKSAPVLEMPEITSEDIIDIAKRLPHHCLRLLGVKLGFNSAQIGGYEQDMKFNLPYFYNTFIKMLEEWKRKEIRTRKELEDIIASIESLKSATADRPLIQSVDLDVAQFREELKQYYLGKYCRIKRDPWENQNFKLETYFTKLSLLEIKKGISSVRKVSLQNSHNDIFSLEVDGNKPSRLFVRGEGGTGKSTLCKKLAYDWAQRETNSPLKDIPIVCVVEFRRLKETDNIEDAICSQLLSLSSRIRPEQIKAYMEQHPSDIILIFDGLDEFKSTKYTGDINEILQWESLRDVRILVTTRPWHSLSLPYNAQYTQIDLEGFDDSGVVSYVQTYFPNETTKYMKQIEANKVIRHLAATPILLAMICYVLKHSSNVSDITTLGQLFDYFLRALFFNKESDTSVTGGHYTDHTPAEPAKMQKLKGFWNDLGKIALPALLEPGKKILFSHSDFADRNEILDTGLIVGLLVRHESEPSDEALEVQEVYYSFPHLLFQEKCAGDYLKTCDQTTLQAHLQNIRTKDEALNLQYMLLFTSGKKTSRKTTESIINYLVTLHSAHESHLRKPNLDGKPQDGDKQRIATKLSQGLSFMTQSLFELGLLINYESQMEGKMSKSLTDFLRFDYFMQLSEQDLVYPAQVYFLEYTKISITSISKAKFTSSAVSFDHALRMLSPSRDLEIVKSSISVIKPYLAKESSMSNLTRITLRRISTNIPLCDVLTLTTALCPVMTYLELNRCRIDVKPYTELRKMLCKAHPSLTEFKVDKCREVISMIDLLGITSIMCPELDMLSLNRCRVEIPDHTQLQKTDCKKKKSQLTIDIRCYSDVSLVDLIAAASVFYQSLQAIRIYTVEQWTDDKSCGIKLSHPTDSLPSDTMIELEYMDLSWHKEDYSLISVYRVLTLTSVMCPQLKNLMVKDCDLDIPHARRDNEGRMMCLKTLELCGTVKLSVQLNDFISMASSLFPKLEKMHVQTWHNINESPIRYQLRRTTQEKMKSLEKLELDFHQQSISIIDIIRTVAQFCPQLKDLAVSVVGDTTSDEWKANALVCHKMLSLEKLRVSSASESLCEAQRCRTILTLDDVWLMCRTIPFSTFLEFTAEVCPHVRELNVSHCRIDLQHFRTNFTPCRKMSYLQEIHLSFEHRYPVPLFHVLSTMSKACPNLRNARIDGHFLISESSGITSRHKLMALGKISLCSKTTAKMFGLLLVVKDLCPNVTKVDIISPNVMYSDEVSCGKISSLETIHLESMYSGDPENDEYLYFRPVLVRTANLCLNLKQMCIKRYEIALSDEAENASLCQLLSLKSIELTWCRIPSLVHLFEVTNSICPNLRTLRISGCKFPVSKQSSRVTCVQPTHIEVLELDYWDGMNGEMRCESFESIKKIIATWCPNAKDPVLTFEDDGDYGYLQESSDSEREDF